MIQNADQELQYELQLYVESYIYDYVTGEFISSIGRSLQRMLIYCRAANVVISDVTKPFSASQYLVCDVGELKWQYPTVSGFYYFDLGTCVPQWNDPTRNFYTYYLRYMTRRSPFMDILFRFASIETLDTTKRPVINQYSYGELMQSFNCKIDTFYKGIYPDGDKKKGYWLPEVHYNDKTLVAGLEWAGTDIYVYETLLGFLVDQAPIIYTPSGWPPKPPVPFKKVGIKELYI